MGACDIVASNLTIIYLATLVCLKIYGVVHGWTYGFIFATTCSTTIVAFILVATLMWDLFQKFISTSCVFVPEQPPTISSCKGGICWHGVAERYPASKMSIKLPRRLLHVDE
ncbi:hypothetical protein TSUD_02330 [Trifolium subterraneum]|nr:hypothetical protein TSUD_02330 [Trifolium subterraneum]